MSPARRQRGGILSFFLLAGLAFTGVGVYLLLKGLGEDDGIGPSASLITGGTFAMIGVIWVLVALGVGGWYRSVATRQAEEQQLFQTGERAVAVIEGVEGTGTEINNQPQVYLTLRVKPRSGQEFIHQRKLVLPFGSVVQPGHLVDVAYDPSNPERVALDVDPRYAATPPAVYIRTRAPDGSTPVTSATAAYAPTAPQQAPASSDPPTLVEQLERLAKLRDSGALTDAEFEQQKKELLGG
ncbi:MAG: SHOCT domain-containing protein [Actinomycetota bacterium]|nr:SHOCT domain-containing protein [Actinomycetota bacterium]